MTSREELIALIVQAFDGVEQPEMLTLHVAEAHDDYDYDHDDEHRAKDFVGPWQNIPDEHIRKCQCALSYVDAVGMRYYLPAYMVWYLRQLESGGAWSEHALYSLDPHLGHSVLSAYQIKRFSLFNAEQLRACAQFLKYCAEEEPEKTDGHFAANKYRKYWYQFDV